MMRSASGTLSAVTSTRRPSDLPDLRVNFPLAALRDDRSEQAKSDWLRDWVKTKIAANEVRSYQESTVLFDE